MTGLSKKQLERQDLVDNEIRNTLDVLFFAVQPKNQQGTIDWDIEDISKVREKIYEILEPLGVLEFDFYPSLMGEEEEDD